MVTIVTGHDPEPIKQQHELAMQKHGTVNCYNCGCRCDLCTQIKMLYNAKARNKSSQSSIT